MLVAFYASSISTIIAGGGLNNGRPIPSTIEGVAITFLKRFYLRTSVLDWHPKVIMQVARPDHDHRHPAIDVTLAKLQVGLPILGRQGMQPRLRDRQLRCILQEDQTRRHT